MTSQAHSIEIAVCICSHLYPTFSTDHVGITVADSKRANVTHLLKLIGHTGFPPVENGRFFSIFFPLRLASFHPPTSDICLHHVYVDYSGEMTEIEIAWSGRCP
jgi:hypothetical protein